MVLVQQSLLYHCSIDHCKQPKKPKKFKIYIKYIKSPWDKTFGVVRELGIKIIEGLFVAISSLFFNKDQIHLHAMQVVPYPKQDSKICRGLYFNSNSM